MTSKNLFFKRMKQDFEQRIWLPVIFFILGLLVMELRLVSVIDSRKDSLYFAEHAKEYLLNGFFTPSYVVTVLTIGVAVISALSGFSYMHSSKKLDVYHSLPVRREKLFAQQYIYGVLYYLAPMALHVIFCLVICMANGLLQTDVFVQALWHMLVQLLVYLAVYSVTVTAVCLTGNLVISVLGSAVLLLYSMIVSGLSTSLTGRFFVTYQRTGSWNELPAFSPVHLIVKMVQEMDAGGAEYLVYTDYAGYYVKLAFMAVVYTVIALLLYRKRPTEAAGRTMAFSFTEPIVKTMIVLPVSLVSGFLFAGIIAGGNSFAWYVFGCSFGFVICCPLMEIIFRKDMKAVFSRPLQLVFNGACVVCIVVIFRFDVFGYDTYFPKVEEVESYAISFDGFSAIRGDYGNATRYRLDNMTLTDNESARKLLEYAAELTRPARMGETEIKEGTSLLVKYCLKNGKAVYRSYVIDVAEEQVMQWLGEIYNDVEYKKGAYPVLDDENRSAGDYAGALLLDYAYASEAIPLSEEKMQRFIETYRSELQNLSFEEVLTEYPVANLAFAEANSGGSYDTMATEAVSYGDGSDFGYNATEYGYKIYPSFTQTLALLEEYGADIADEIAPEDVVSIQISDYRRVKYDESGALVTTPAELEYTQENGQLAQIEELLPCLTWDNLEVDFSMEERYEQGIYVRVTYRYDGKTYERDSFYMIKDKIPEFLKEDLEETAG